MSGPNDANTPGISAGSAALPSNVPTNNTQSSNSPFVNPIGNPPTAPENLDDTAGRRVRLRPKPAAVGTVYGSFTGLLFPLVTTKGMVFPYQPSITYQQEVTYQPMEMVHANQDFHVYSKTPALKLQVDGDFTVQSQKEGQYALACLHFLRTVTKMYFSGTDARQGTPPPVLLFDAYGQYMFNSLPVIVTGFTMTLPKDVDYVPVQAGGNNTAAPSGTASGVNKVTQESIASGAGQNGYSWLPAAFVITVNLTVQQTPQRLRAFDLDEFRTGELLRQGGWA